MKSVCLALAALPLLGLSSIASAGVMHPGTAAISAPPILLRVSEELGTPPPDAPGVTPPEITPENMQRLFDADLRDRFDSATGANGILTAQAANDAGWGFAADHFTEIDRDHDGYATFSEVQTFFDARSPLPAARVRAAAKVQVVE
jgi:hypothetical protein